jgi:hypothetical protein
MGSAWSCPACRRRFAKRNQAHSCSSRSVESHFEGKPAALRAVFARLVRELKKTGPLRVDAVSGSINLISRHHFAGVHVRKEYLRLGFILDRELRHPRILRVERLGPRRIGHFVRVHSLRDLNAELLGWLAEAQAMQTRTGRSETSRASAR